MIFVFFSCGPGGGILGEMGCPCLTPTRPSVLGGNLPSSIPGRFQLLHSSTSDAMPTAGWDIRERYSRCALPAVWYFLHTSSSHFTRWKTRLGCPTAFPFGGVSRYFCGEHDPTGLSDYRFCVSRVVSVRGVAYQKGRLVSRLWTIF